MAYRSTRYLTRRDVLQGVGLATIGLFAFPTEGTAQNRTFSFTVSGANFTRIVNALSVRFGYMATLEDGLPNPQSAAEFVRLRIAQWIVSETQDHELAAGRSAIAPVPLPVS